MTYPTATPSSRRTIARSSHGSSAGSRGELLEPPLARDPPSPRGSRRDRRSRGREVPRRPRTPAATRGQQHELEPLGHDRRLGWRVVGRHACILRSACRLGERLPPARTDVAASCRVGHPQVGGRYLSHAPRGLFGLGRRRAGARGSVAPEEGARARETARARARAPAPSRTGDGRSLARARAGTRRPTTSIRPCTSPVAPSPPTRSRSGTKRCSSPPTSTWTGSKLRPWTREHAGSAAAYGAALALYGGELLPENRYDDWAEDRRNELADLVDELQDELAGLGATDVPRGLPVDASSFIGRERELAELRTLLARTRLLTLSGTGGAGKTRLALELARAAETSYADGAALVPLAPLTDSRLVPDAVAAALDVRALPGQNIVAALLDDLASRTLLLVLDNCEHLLGASAALADVLLRSAPGLTVLATSREALRIPGEVVFRVPSLDIPDPDRRPTPEELVRYEAARLFVERAAAVAPGFTLDTDNAQDVGRDLLPARRFAPRTRARRRPVGCARCRRDRSPARRPLRPAALRQPCGADAAADARGNAAVESRPARARRADALPPAGRIRRRLRAGGRRGSRQRRRDRGRGHGRRARAARREVARDPAGRRTCAPLSATRDRAPVRT